MLTSPPPPFSTILDALSARARSTPDALAYAVEEDSITYGQLLDDVTIAANALARLGLSAGDRCALLLPTGIDFVRVLYGVQMAGATPVAIDHSLPAEAILRRLKQIWCDLAITDGDLAAGLESREHPNLKAAEAQAVCRPKSPCNEPVGTEVRPDLAAFLQFTSGTAGEPKVVMIEHRHLVAYLEETMRRLTDGVPHVTARRDVFVGWVPLYHDLGLVRFVFTPLFAGRPAHLVQPSIADLRHWLETISRVRGSVTAAPDFAFRLAARTVNPKGLDLSSLRFATSGGEPVRLNTIELFEQRFGVPGTVRPAYGLAEATLGVTSLAPGEPVRTDVDGNVSCGAPMGGAEIRIVGDEGNESSVGEAGEIVVRCPWLFAGYLDDELTTREVLRNGWLHTGDIGKLDEDGHLYVLGRRRAMIKRGGATIAPREIEEAADCASGVRFSAAIGVERDTSEGTEQIVILAEIRKDYKERDLPQISRTIVTEVQRSTGYSPQEVVLVAPRTIPRTRNGKIRYELLRELFLTGELARQGQILLARGLEA